MKVYLIVSVIFYVASLIFHVLAEIWCLAFALVVFTSNRSFKALFNNGKSEQNIGLHCHSGRTENEHSRVERK